MDSFLSGSTVFDSFKSLVMLVIEISAMDLSKLTLSSSSFGAGLKLATLGILVSFISTSSRSDSLLLLLKNSIWISFIRFSRSTFLILRSSLFSVLMFLISFLYFISLRLYSIFSLNEIF